MLLHTALSIEARPLIDHWKLRRQWSSRLGAYAESADEAIGLIVSGTGVPSAAAAVAATLARLESAGRTVRGLVSVGLTGCPWSDWAPGTPRLINQIREVSSGRTHYPDVLYRHPWEETSLETHGRPVTAKDAPQTLVDMEAAGVFVAARAFLSSHSIVFLKIVSDHLEGGALSPDQVREWIAAQVPTLAEFVGHAFHAPERLPTVPEDLRAAMDAWAEAYRLTATQRVRLRESTRAAYLRGRTEWTVFDQRPEEPLAKTARNVCFEELCDELATTV